jgi:hypothetical protein
MLSLLCLLLAADHPVQLTLIPNATEILQRDNLLLLSVLENRSISAVHVMPDKGEDLGGGHICYEIEKDGSWVRITPAFSQIAFLCGLKGKLVLSGESSYAERESIHRRSLKGAFLFETPGTYKLRAVAQMPWGEHPSEPVTITVKARPEIDLQAIESVTPMDLWALGRPSLERPLPENLLKLKSVGGNIAHTLEQWEMAQAACEGGKWKDAVILKEKNCQWMKKNMDSVALEHSLDVLSRYYLSKRHWEALPRCLEAMQYDSSMRRELIYQQKLLARPPTPAIPEP